MKIDNNVSDSISEYTCYTNKSQIIKILFNPLDYLEGLKKSNHFLVTNSFIYTENQLYKYMQYIKDMMKQGFYNYYNSPNTLDFVLYRAMSESEFDGLKNNGVIDNFYSTFSSFPQARNYILDNYADVYKDNHYIVELNLSEVLPFIDVSVDSGNCYERGEKILLPEFFIRDLVVVKNQHYYHTIYEAKARIEPIKKEKYDIQDVYLKLNELYFDISENIYNYGKLINEYLKNNVEIRKNDGFID